MKRLTVMRHGHANSHALDMQRHLSDTGRLQVQRAATYLKAADIAPDFIICSSAMRTKETAEILADCFAPITIKSIEALYNGTAQQYLAEISKIRKDATHLLLVGHNPVIPDIVHQLTSHTQHVMAAPASLFSFQLPSFNLLNHVYTDCILTHSFTPN